MEKSVEAKQPELEYEKLPTTPKRPATGNKMIFSPKKIKLDIESFRGLIDMIDQLASVVIMVRIRNISNERSIKMGNRNMKTFHMDGFDRKGDGIRFLFFDQMVNRWDNLLYV